MNDRPDACWLRREISGELTDIVGWLADEDLTATEFANTIAELERRKLTRHGFTLSSAVSSNSVVHFTLRFADTGEFCASLDVNPHTGAVVVQSAP